MTGTPTNVSAEMISPTTISVTWRPPSDTSEATVTGYTLQYTDIDEVERIIRLHPLSLSRIISCESRNITVQASSFQSIPSTPVAIPFILREFQQIGLMHGYAETWKKSGNLTIYSLPPQLSLSQSQSIQ